MAPGIVSLPAAGGADTCGAHLPPVGRGPSVSGQGPGVSPRAGPVAGSRQLGVHETKARLPRCVSVSPMWGLDCSR